MTRHTNKKLRAKRGKRKLRAEFGTLYPSVNLKKALKRDATRERIRLERESLKFLSVRSCIPFDRRRLEEREAIKFLEDVPSVEAILVGWLRNETHAEKRDRIERLLWAAA